MWFDANATTIHTCRFNNIFPQEDLRASKDLGAYRQRRDKVIKMRCNDCLDDARSGSREGTVGGSPRGRPDYHDGQ
jgi:hypothetical protein